MPTDPTSYPRLVFYALCAVSLFAVSKADTGSETSTAGASGAPGAPGELGLGLGLEAEVEAEAAVEDIAYEATRQLGDLNQRLNLLAREEQARQVALPNMTLNDIVSRVPCTCDEGICKCCAGFLAVIGMNSCTEVVYNPEEFSFELRMRVNNNVWFRRKVSGQNPPPFCFRPPRFNFARACIQFHDIWFAGRNMHVCMHMSGSFQGYDLFERNFDCLLFGEKGVKIVKPEQGYPVRPTAADVDDGGDDDIEDYDENVVRRKRTQPN